MTHSQPVFNTLKRVGVLCLVMLATMATPLAAARMIPVIFAAGLTFPNTTKTITPSNPDVESRLKGYFEQNIEVVFLHNMGRDQDPWYGVRGSVVEVNEQSEQSESSKEEKTSFKVTFTDLAQVHNPLHNIKKSNGRYYARNITFIKDIDSPQTVATFLHEVILPSLPGSHRSQALRKKLAPLTSINQIVQELILHFKLEASEEQAVQFLEFNFSIQDKLRLLMDLFEQARKSGKLSGGRPGKGGASREDEFEQFQKKLDDADLSDQARDELEEILEQFEGAKDNPHEGPMLRNYLKFALSLPWSTGTDPREREEFDLAKVEQRLNEDQYGMEVVKDRMLDYLALRNISPTPTPTIICLVGAPGVGKTSICKVIADALDKKFARIALGGVHSEADIRGHRRTYVGAMPGRILEAMKRAKTHNPVIVLDEIDKLGTENQMHGDPSAALLEALDPEQNSEFTDHYLGVPFDLSKVIFIATANDGDAIPPALRDRMDIIQVPSYTVEEKIEIAREIIVPKMVKRSGLTTRTPYFSDNLLRAIIERYTFEDGLRGFSNKLNVLIAKFARGYLKDETVVFTPDNLSTYLGKAHAQLSEIKRKAKIIEPALPKETKKRIFEKIRRFEQMKNSDPEKSRLRAYLEFFVSLPWTTTTEDNPDLNNVKEHLEKAHYGLEKVHEDILDALALSKRSEKARATILCLTGPPGVGKTSICKAIASAMGKKFARIALGGVHTESQLRGTAQSYVGASAGSILEALQTAGSKNALIVLDEIDKMGKSAHQGDPEGALLEILDREQNYAFKDNYLDEPFDLSQVLFIATANDLDQLSWPLKDRLKIISLEGYNTKQKIYIAEKHILPKLIKQANLEERPLKFDTELLKKIIRGYTMEAGVRNLSNKLNKLIAKYARALDTNKPFKLNEKSLVEHLGVGRERSDVIPEKDTIGVVNGLSYSQLGGNLLMIEAAVMPGKGKIHLTGRLGKVIKESARAALTYARTYGKKWGVRPEQSRHIDIHVNYPSGVNGPMGVEGPSAGAAMTTAIISALTNRPIRHDCAMTGTIDLQGRVGPIGGVDQKIDAAHRSKMKYILFSEKNKADVEELKEKPKDIKIIFVKHIDEILEHVLLPADPHAIAIA